MTDNYLEKFEKMRKAGSLASNTLDMISTCIKPGITTNEIDKLGYEFIRDNGGYSAPLYYRGFKKSLCTSLNHVVCHGIPSERILNDGDILNIDVTAIVENYYGDTSRMFCVGKAPIKATNKTTEIAAKGSKYFVSNRVPTSATVPAGSKASAWYHGVFEITKLIRIISQMAKAPPTPCWTLVWDKRTDEIRLVSIIPKMIKTRIPPI